MTTAIATALGELRSIHDLVPSPLNPRRHFDKTKLDELHDAIRTKLPPAKWKILESLIAVYPKAKTKDALAEEIGVSPTSGGYFNNLGSLRSLGLIDYPRPSEVAALPVLFLEER